MRGARWSRCYTKESLALLVLEQRTLYFILYMNTREITIGRSKDCDIYLDPNCQYASSHHAVIYYDGRQLMYRDISTNGTMINNQRIHKRAVPIRRGDIIMLAGKYQLNWNQIDYYFPPQQSSFYGPSETANTGGTQPANFRMAEEAAQSAPVDVNKWSWGAFVLYPIWGFFNGCWWAIFVGIFLGWLAPIPNIIFGIYGGRWAWQNKQWTSLESFASSQKGWNTAGLIIFCLNLAILLLFVIFYFILGAAILSCI